MPEWMNDFIIFYAPFLVLAIAILIVFIIAPKDEVIAKEEERPTIK